MDARLLTRCTNVALVTVVGMGAAHLLMPSRPDSGVAGRAAFGALVAGAGVVAGLRERAVTLEYGVGVSAAAPVWGAAGAGAALVLAALAWYVVHA